MRCGGIAADWIDAGGARARLGDPSEKPSSPMKRFVLVGLLACSKPPNDVECRSMLDRYVDMTIDGDPEISTAPETARPALHAAKMDRKREEATYKTSLDRCTHEVSRREWDCAM